ncbi:MAG: class I SAM-dependent methyltransferase [Deinococcota bacterium]
MKKALISPWVFNEAQDFGWSDSSTIENYNNVARGNSSVERQRLIDLGVSKEHVLMDIGCGTGTLVLEAAKLCKTVIALDVAKPMLDYLKNDALQLGIHNINYVNQGFLSYEHAQDPVDFVVSQHTFHHLPDFWKVQALQGVYDVLKPGGVLLLHDVLFSFEPQEAEVALENWMTNVSVTDGDGFPKSFFEQQVREEYYTYTWLFEAMLEKVGFKIMDIDYGNYAAHGGYLCVKPSETCVVSS